MNISWKTLIDMSEKHVQVSDKDQHESVGQRIRELADRCWDQRLDGWHFDQEMFAELIKKECAGDKSLAQEKNSGGWVGLTDEEIKALSSWWPSYDQMPALMTLARDIENTLKEKNA